MAYNSNILDTGTDGRSFATITLAEAASLDITTGDGVFNSIQCYADSVFDEGDITFIQAGADDQWGGNELVAAPGEEWNGPEGSGVLIQPTGSHVVIMTMGGEGRWKIEGLELDGSAAAAISAVLFNTNQRFGNISRCAFHDAPSGNGVAWGSLADDAFVQFSVAYNNAGSGFSHVGVNEALRAYFCGAHNNGVYGFTANNANFLGVVGCWAFANTTADYNNAVTAVKWVGSANIAGDASLGGGSTVLNLTSQAIGDMNFVDSANGDYRITAGSIALARGPARMMAPQHPLVNIAMPRMIDMVGSVLDATMDSAALYDTGPHQFSYPPVVLATVPTPTPNATVVDPLTDMDLTGTIDNAGSFVSGDILTVHLDSDDSEVGVGDAAAGTWRASGLTNGVLQTLKLKAHRSGATSSAFSSTVQGTPTGTPTVGVGRIIAVVSPETIVGVVTEG